MLVRKKKASKPSKVPMVDRIEKCDYCGNNFNWRYEGVANAAGKVFCNVRCFDENRQKSARMVGSDAIID